MTTRALLFRNQFVITVPPDDVGTAVRTACCHGNNEEGPVKFKVIDGKA